MYAAPIVFKNGMAGRLVYPDFYDRLMAVGDVPDPDVIAVMELLRGEGSLPKQNLLDKVQSDTRHYLRLYRLAALCLDSPRLILMRRKCGACGHGWDGDLKTCDHCMSADTTIVHERNAGEIGPRDLTIFDLVSIHQDFFWSAAATIGPMPAEDTGGATDALWAGGDVPHDAGGAAAHNGTGSGDQPERVLPAGGQLPTEEEAAA